MAARLRPSHSSSHCCRGGGGKQKATPQDTSPQALFARIDTNSDGKVSKEEATRLPSVATRWEELDKNHDGWLSREEFIAGFRT